MRRSDWVRLCSGIGFEFKNIFIVFFLFNMLNFFLNANALSNLLSVWMFPESMWKKHYFAYFAHSSWMSRYASEINIVKSCKKSIETYFTVGTPFLDTCEAVRVTIVPFAWADEGFRWRGAIRTSMTSANVPKIIKRRMKLHKTLKLWKCKTWGLFLEKKSHDHVMWVRGLMSINVGCQFCGRGSIPSVTDHGCWSWESWLV